MAWPGDQRRSTLVPGEPEHRPIPETGGPPDTGRPDTGRPGDELWESWPALAAFADREPRLLASILAAASAPDSANTTAGAVNSDAVAFAMIDTPGRRLRGDDRFRLWVGEPAESVDCLELARKAAVHGRASGRVRTHRHGVLVALALADPSASPWPRLAQQQGFALADKGVLIVVFAPSRSRRLIESAAEGLNLSPLQRRMAVALLDEPTLDAAAAALGVGRETARDALDGALRKAGVRRSSQLIGRLIDLGCHLTDRPANQGVIAAATLGLSRAEGGVAERIAEGDTVGEAAVALGLKAGTVKAYRRSVFEKLGVNRSRDLCVFHAIAGTDSRGWWA